MAASSLSHNESFISPRVLVSESTTHIFLCIKKFHHNPLVGCAVEGKGLRICGRNCAQVTIINFFPAKLCSCAQIFLCVMKLWNPIWRRGRKFLDALGVWLKCKFAFANAAILRCMSPAARQGRQMFRGNLRHLHNETHSWKRDACARITACSAGAVAAKAIKPPPDVANTGAAPLVSLASRNCSN